MLLHQTNHRVATEIHERPGLGQHQFLAAYFANANPGAAFPVVETNRMKPGEVIQTSEASVVAITGIGPTWIA